GELGDDGDLPDPSRRQRQRPPVRAPLRQHGVRLSRDGGSGMRGTGAQVRTSPGRHAVRVPTRPIRIRAAMSTRLTSQQVAQRPRNFMNASTSMRIPFAVALALSVFALPSAVRAQDQIPGVSLGLVYSGAYVPSLAIKP